MRKILLAIAAAATVLATIAPAFAEQDLDCTVQSRENWARCTFESATNRGG